MELNARLEFVTSKSKGEKYRTGVRVVTFFVSLIVASVWIARRVGELNPSNCFLHLPNRLSNYVLGGQQYTIYIRFTSQFWSGSDDQKVQPSS